MRRDAPPDAPCSRRGGAGVQHTHDWSLRLTLLSVVTLLLLLLLLLLQLVPTH